jgi:hypothetical protein
MLLFGMFELEILSSAPEPHRESNVDPTVGEKTRPVWKINYVHPEYGGTLIPICDNINCSKGTKLCKKQHPGDLYYLTYIPVEHSLSYLQSMLQTEHANKMEKFRRYLGFTDAGKKGFTDAGKKRLVNRL